MEKSVRLITCVGHFMTHFYILIISALLTTLAHSWKLSIEELTAIGAAGYFLYGLGSLPAGWLVNRIGPKTSLLIFFGGSCLVSIFIALSTSVVAFSIGIILLGLFGSLYHVSGSTLLTHYTKKMGKSFGLHGVAGSAGITFVPIIATFLAAFFGSKEAPYWQIVYYFAALLGLAGFLFLLFNRSIPLITQHKEENKETDLQGFQKVLPFIIIYFAIMAINGTFYRAFLTIFKTYIDQRASFEDIHPFLTGGFITTIILLTGMLGQFLGGLISDKYDRLKFYIFILCAIVPLVISIGFLSAVPLVIAGLLFSLFFFPIQPIENSLLSLIVPRRFISHIFGLKFVMTFGVGSIGAYMAGYITEHFGIEKVFPAISILVLISIILAIQLLRLSRKMKLNL